MTEVYKNMSKDEYLPDDYFDPFITAAAEFIGECEELSLEHTEFDYFDPDNYEIIYAIPTNTILNSNFVFNPDNYEEIYKNKITTPLHFNYDSTVKYIKGDCVKLSDKYNEGDICLKSA